MSKYHYFRLIVIYAITPFLVSAHQLAEKNLEETLTIPPEQITKLTLDTPDNYHYKSTTNQRKIKFFTNYLSQLTYERMLADRTGYMPDRASIIYLDGNNQSNFIVPYTK